jgi:hypothetical protein
MTTSSEDIKRYKLRDETLVKLFLLVTWPLVVLFLSLALGAMALVVFFSIPFFKVYDKDGKVSIDLPGMRKIRR